MQTYALRPLHVTAERIQRDAKKAGYDFTVAEVQREVSFLVDEGFLVAVDARGTTDKTVRIHADGIRHYEQTYA